MSADNAVAILITRDKFRKSGEHSWTNTWDEGAIAYRVAHIQSADNFQWLINHEIHNLGAWMQDCFSLDEVFYDEREAFARARELIAEIGFVEYGIITLDGTAYNFPCA